MRKVACYVDGFNLYHAIDDLQKPYLKWLDLFALATSLCRPGEEIVRVSYFSAYATWLPDRYARHREFVAALRATGVTCHIARFSTKTVRCHGCKATWKSREEKETDVHFALTFLEDAIDGVFDRAIIVSADSDYVPAVRRVRARLPGREVFLAAPPGRFGDAHELRKVCTSAIAMTPGRLAKCLLPEQIVDATGKVLVARPPQYDPPV
jgi:uncharacterized LabA/DUF88 family protein